MELSLSAVEALIHRAKKSLHQRLYEYFERVRLVQGLGENSVRYYKGIDNE